MKKKGERGQALTEFALIVPIFLLLVFAIVDFGMGFNAWITVTNSTREGARLGAVGGTSGAITTQVKNAASSLDQSKLSVAVTGAQGASGSDVGVTTTYQYDLISPLSGIFSLVSGGTIGPSLNVSSTSHMRIE